MSKIEVDTIAPQSGTEVTIGESGDTITVPTGVTFDTSNSTVTLPDGSVTNAKIADSTIQLAKLSATGTKDATTFLRGDNTFAEAGGGKVLQVISTNDTTARSTTSTSYVTSTVSATITPSSTSSKIFIIVTGTLRNGTFNIFRDATDIGGGDGFCMNESGTNNAAGAMSYLDSPNTTSAVTYTGYHKANFGGTSFFGVGGFTVFTVMEISA